MTKTRSERTRYKEEASVGTSSIIWILLGAVLLVIFGFGYQGMISIGWDTFAWVLFGAGAFMIGVGVACLICRASCG